MKSEYKNRYLLAGMLEGNFQSYFNVHEVPKEVVEGKPAPDPGNASPFGDLTDEPHANAKSNDGKDEDAVKKPDEKSPDPKPDPKKDDGGAATDGGAQKPGGGGPRVDDQEGSAAPAAAPANGAKQEKPKAVPPAKADGAKPPETPAAPKQDAKTEPAKPFEYLKQSQATGRILVIGCSDFVSDMTLQGSSENAFLLQNAAGYMAAENLSTLRAKRLDDRPFDNPSDATKSLATFLGWFAAPLVVLFMLVLVYVWRRVWRPAANRRRMAAAAAN
jgi:hypothetical protein